MNKIIFITIIILGYFTSLGQYIKLEGNYSGKNIYVQNNLLSNNSYCTDSITVNGKKVYFKNSNTYEIHLDSLKFEFGHPIKILIFHNSNCQPNVLNKEVLSNYYNSIENLSINDEGIISWTTQKEYCKTKFIIEQKKWTKWVVIDSIESKGKQKENNYKYKAILHSGENEFRIKQNLKYRIIVNPKEPLTLKVNSLKSKINLECDTNSKTLRFSDYTHFEIYNKCLKKVRNGYEKDVDFSALDEGKYLLNYDNLSISLRLNSNELKLKKIKKKDFSHCYNITLKHNKKNNTIEFSDTTKFEIYDAFGNIIIKGYDNKVDVSDCKTGIHYINYDNRTEKIKVRNKD